jgi:hydroxyethylthiazole kinase-like uncharacterized protein yjeF
MRIVSAAEMRAIDLATTQKYGVPSLTLMENAGSSVAEFILEEFPEAERIAVVCGKGNNGGDGFVVARKLAEAAREVKTFLLTGPSEVSGDAAAMLRKLPSVPQSITSEAELNKLEISEFDLIVDAILGTGFRPPAKGLYAAAIRAINESGRTVVSVDIPSGAEADAERPAANDAQVHVRADAIVTFTALKPAHVFRFPSVQTVVKQIGSPEEAVVSQKNLNLITPEDFQHLLAPRNPDSNKGIFGHVLVIGGAVGKAGAPAMCAMASLRSGTGLVTVAVPKSILPTVASFAPELMTEGLAETDRGCLSNLGLEALRSLSKGKSAIAIGPGASREPEAAQLIRDYVEQSALLPMVIDADGLNAFQDDAEVLKTGKGRRFLILTPHPGEMSRLIGLTVKEIQQDRIGIAKKFALEHGVWLVLKGYMTVVAEPSGKVWINPTGNPGMATGGTGDILTGIIAGMVAQHQSDIAAAVIAAVYMHGMAGDMARDEMGEISMTATDLLLALPAAFQRLASETVIP